MSVLPSDIRVYSSACDPAYDGSTTLNGAINNSVIALVVAAFATFPLSGEFNIQIDSEIMRVTQGAGTLNWTVIRNYLGTTAASHSNAASISMPAGGQANFNAKVSFTDVTSGDTLDYISSSTSDTLAQVKSTVRDATGVLQTETKTLNGQTAVNGAQASDRLLTARFSAVTTASGAINNSVTTLAVASGGALPGSGNYYIKMADEIMQVTGGQGTTSLTVSRNQKGTTATAHNSGDDVILLPLGDVAVVDHTKVISGHTAQAGSANSTGITPATIKLQAGDGASISLGQIIVITSGTGVGQIRSIIKTSGYGVDFVGVNRDWGTVPDNTSVYSVYNGMLFDLSPNPITSVRRFLWNAAADIPGGSTRIYYEKVFVSNDNTSIAQVAAQIQIASDTPSLGSASLDIALATALNDTTVWGNRQTAPGSGFGSFITQPSLISVTANSGNLPPGAAPNAAGGQAVCMRLTVPAGTAPYKGSADLQTYGNSI